MRVELTKRADYAIRATLALARTPDGERRSVRRMAADQRIPVGFLPQVMADLVKAGLAEATVGRTGGYRLAKPSTEISLLDVVEAVEGERRGRVCVIRGGPCAIDSVCDVHTLFAGAEDDVFRRFRAMTVAEAVAAD
jgi:Rrf2 family transcriptional regulator, iron-sulfur cluster assembly transcription factor